MGKSFFELERLDPDALRRVAARLREVGYTEEGVRSRLGLDDLSEITLAHYPYFLDYRLRKTPSLDMAIRLFLLQGEVTAEGLRELFSSEAIKTLRQAHVLAGDRPSRSYRARVSLYPVGERLFFTDHPFAHRPWLKARVPTNPVMHLGRPAYWLARSAIQRPVSSVLDLCCGSGVHAILAAAQAERAVGVDVSARAVNFARLNALMNDAWNAVFVEGDLHSALSGERFDLVLANPPFVPSPVYQLAHRDGGPSGADVLRRIVASLPDCLSEGGVAQIVTQVAEREGEPYMERVRRWLGGANFNMHSVFLGEEAILDYSRDHVQQVFGERYERYSASLVDWVTNLRSQRFSRVVSTVLTFQWNHAPQPPWTQEDESKPPVRQVAKELSRILSARTRMRQLSSLQELDPMRVGIPDDILLIERRQPTGGGFESKDFRVVFRDHCLSPELDIKPLVRDLLERIDNRSTVVQVIERLAEDTQRSRDELLERCRKAFVVMFERGLVTLDPPAQTTTSEVPLEVSQDPDEGEPAPHQVVARAESVDSSADSAEASLHPHSE